MERLKKDFVEADKKQTHKQKTIPESKERCDRSNGGLKISVLEMGVRLLSR